MRTIARATITFGDPVQEERSLVDCAWFAGQCQIAGDRMLFPFSSRSRATWARPRNSKTLPL